MTQRILVVEDEPTIADTICYTLSTEGFDVLCHTTAHAAREALAEQQLHLMVLDVGLPDQNGFEFCKEIRKGSQVPIIFLSARSEEIDRILGLEIGGDDYMAKPFSPRELAARVKAVLRRLNAPTSPMKSILPKSPFTLHEQKMLISYYEHPLSLSRYEYRLLKVLLRRPGWVYSREKLMDMVWEEPQASMDRTVDTHVKTIRAKLRKITSEVDAIITHRGMGYSLRETW